MEKKIISAAKMIRLLGPRVRNPKFCNTHVCLSRWRVIVCEARVLCKCDLMLSRRRNPRRASHFRLFERL